MFSSLHDLFGSVGNGSGLGVISVVGCQYVSYELHTHTHTHTRPISDIHALSDFILFFSELLYVLQEIYV